VSAGALLELHAAAQHFLRRKNLADAEARERLRRAIAAVLRGRGRIETPAEALTALRLVLERCEELKVNWTEVVTLVNREYAMEEAGHV
jgi:hypothetical protein